MRNGYVNVNGKQVELYNFDYQPSQLYHQIRNVQALGPFEGCTSGARKQMFKSHISQRLLIKNPTLKRIFTGAEFECAKAVFDSSFEFDSEIIRVIPYYKTTIGQHEIGPNPETLVIFEHFDPEEKCLVVDCMSISDYSSHHSYFGYKNKRTKLFNKLAPGSTFEAGDVITTSPAVHDNGSMMYGKELEIALMTHECSSEDGVGMAASLAEELGIITLEKRVVEFGSTMYPKNLYGTKDKFQAYPRIGQKIHDSGILMAFTKYDQDYSPVTMSRRKAMEVDSVFDSAVYVDGSDGVVVDIRVLHDSNQVMNTPEIMAEQSIIYDNARREYYKEIVAVYDELYRRRGQSLRVSPRFNNLVRQAIDVKMEREPIKRSGTKFVHPQKLYRGSPIDDFRIEFTIMYKIKPTIGFKITGTQGDKGVFVNVIPDEHMPVNENGIRAQIIMDPNATIARTLPSRVYEQAFNAASRDLVISFYKELGFDYNQKVTTAVKLTVTDMWQKGHPVIVKCWNRLIEYYHIFSSEVQGPGINNLPEDKKLNHFLSVLHDGIYLYIPGTQKEEPVEMLRKVQKDFMPVRGPVRYIDSNGVEQVTKNKVLIGSIYMMLLEKTGDDWTAVSSGKFQIFGVLAKLTNKDKYSQPTRNQAIRAGGEAEIRIIVAYCGAYFAAEFLDRNSNMQTHRVACEMIVSSKTPTNIPVLINRKKYPLGKARSMQLIKHIAYCNGWKFEYKQYKEKELPPDFPVFDYESIST